MNTGRNELRARINIGIHPYHEMVKRGRPKKRLPFEDLPESFRFGMIKMRARKMMAKNNIKDFDRAYNMAGFLLDINSDEFEKEVNKEAERRYRSRHFSEQNKTVKTVHDNAIQSGYSGGLKDGTSQNRIWYCARGLKVSEVISNFGPCILLVIGQIAGLVGYGWR